MQWQHGGTPSQLMLWKMIFLGPFKKVFEDQFMPTVGKTHMYRSFLDLIHGDFSVSEYETKFNAGVDKYPS